MPSGGGRGGNVGARPKLTSQLSEVTLFGARGSAFRDVMEEWESALASSNAARSLLDERVEVEEATTATEAADSPESARDDGR